ncbi:MAG: glycoside hydrolase family 15 protein, partial [Actinomycetota bacterium]|nr:glycoside hydrolase family 15 protein [Actinomycetota bacterium]
MSDRIADFALLGDGQGAALVSRDGSVAWWCPPRFDAPSVFAQILDERAGHWSLRPRAIEDVERRYVPGTMVLETTFRCAGGRMRLTDALALAPGARGHETGHGSPHVLLRVAEALDGEVRVDLELAPRPEYARVVPRLVSTAAGIESIGGRDRVLLVGDRPVQARRDHAAASFALLAGERAGFALQHLPGITGGAPAPLDPVAALDDTIAGWQSWSEQHQGYQGAYHELVHRSALVLRALTYVETGAIVAAATTSLPEVVGASANWDYRYAWLRDAALTLTALWVAACPDEARRFFDWMARAAAPGPQDEHVQIVFGVQGERDLTEHELEHLAGFRDSRPVRVGNAAWSQQQLDVLGEVLQGAWVLRDRLGELDDLTAEFLADLADRAARDWRKPDAGIWEAREGERDYLSSKLLCWVALDRAIRLAPKLRGHANVDAWGEARDAVREAICRDGWSDEAGAYTGAFGSDHLDASVLLMPILGFVDAADERMLATIDAVERDLARDGLVQRWTGAGDEGAFVACSYWLAHCRALAGQVQHARALFEKVS